MNLFWLYEWHWHSFQLGREGETERECVRESESDGREWGCECEFGRERMGCERLREREKEREREREREKTIKTQGGTVEIGSNFFLQ